MVSMKKAPSAAAVIPARAGSTRIKNKNRLPIGGVPLIEHTLIHATSAKCFQEVWVTTDDDRVAEIARNYRVNVVDRPIELASATATSESAMLHVLDHRLSEGAEDPDYVCLLQCTSPIRADDDIDRAFGQLVNSDADSLLTVTENKRFLWRDNGAGAVSVNYDFRYRRREQDLDLEYMENGSIYMTRTELFRRENNRLGGKIVLYVMTPYSAIQIDEPDDVVLADLVLRHRQSTERRAPSPARLDMVIFDFDGVMTDDTADIDTDGGEQVRVFRGDGMGISQLRKTGIEMMVISTEAHPIVAARCDKLKVPYRQAENDKVGYLTRLLSDRGIDPANVVFVGNDVNDTECMRMVGYSIAPPNASSEVLANARYRTKRAGGLGAVRDVCDWVLGRSNDVFFARSNDDD